MKVKEEIPEELLECIKACRKINNKFADKEGWHSHTTFLECRLCQNSVMVVIFIDDMEIIIHHPQNDERPYDESKDKYQPWFSYLRQHLKYRTENIAATKF